MENSSIKFFAVGDCLISRMLYQKNNSKLNFLNMVENIIPYMDGCDFKLYNQESPICGQWIEAKGLRFHPQFGSDYSVGDAMVEAGFNIVNLANNHTLDMGVDGVMNSIAYWESKDVLTLGSALYTTSPVIITKNGVKFGIVSYTNVFNDRFTKIGQEHFRNDFELNRVRSDIEFIKSHGAYCIVVMHWDHEYHHQPSIDTRLIAEKLSKAGCDLIIGMHSHTIQPIEWIGDTCVIWSLGNFIASQSPEDEEKRVGMMVKLNIMFDGSRYLVVPRADLFYINHDSDFTNFKLATRNTDPYIIDWDKYYDIVNDKMNVRNIYSYI